MRGSIQKRAKNHYSIVVDNGTDPKTGKRRQKRRTVRCSKPEAEKILAEMLDQVNKGIYFEPSKMTLEEYLNSWLESNKHNLAPRTYESYSMICKLHLIPALGQIKIQELRPYHLDNYYKEALANGRKDKKGKKLSPTTVNYHHRLLKKTLNDALKKEYIVRNPALAATAPKKVYNEMQVLPDQDVSRLLEEVKGSYLYMPVFLAIGTGMRAGEILGLEWNNVDLDNGVIYINKALQITKEGLLHRDVKTKGSKRSIEIADYIVKMLKRHKAQQSQRRMANPKAYNDKDLVCCWEDGTEVNPGTLSSRFHQIIENLGLNIRFHDLRHTHATTLLKKEIHPKIVSERLGHRQITLTLDTYSHVLPGMQRKAADLFNEDYFKKKDVTNS